MIEYIANGMPTWAYVLIGIAVYEIVKQEAIYLLNNLRAFAEEDDDPAIDMAIEALQDDWTPVSEELPEVGRSVLISDGVWTAEGCYRADGSWQQFRWDCIKEDVIAWRPLPKPYKPPVEQTHGNARRVFGKEE